MFAVDDLIDDRFLVIEICKNQGGMGTVVFVQDLESSIEYALKYCVTEAFHDRFKREVRLMKKYKDNGKVVQIFYSNLEYTYPYFVMEKALGNLDYLITSISSNLIKQEQTLIRMLDCIEELHLNEDIHRDIKPQNFLVYPNELIMITDFGLAKEPDSLTRNTRTLTQAGTEEFAPPEFYKEGGFKNAVKSWDIYSAGKSIYSLITERDARFLTNDNIHPSLYYVIERCCRQNAEDRFQSISEVKQQIQFAYDIILMRVDPQTKFSNLLDQIQDRIKTENTYVTDEFISLIDCLNSLDSDAQQIEVKRIDKVMISVLCNDKQLEGHLKIFLNVFNTMVDSKIYGFEYAEVIADKMKTVFNNKNVTSSEKVYSLEVAIKASLYMNRFSAMTTCKNLIMAIDDNVLAQNVLEILERYKFSALMNEIEPASCSHFLVKRKLLSFKD